MKTKSTTSPYRTAVAVNRCAICADQGRSRLNLDDDQAVARCPRCSRLLCLAHMPADDRARCDCCEAEFGRRRRAISRATSTAAAVAVAGSLVGSSFLLSELTTALGLTACVFIIVAAIGDAVSRAARLHFLRAGERHELMLDSAEIAIAPTSAVKSWRGKAMTPQRRRLEPPCAPIWQRTYGR